MYALANHVTSIMLLITGVYNCMSYSCSSGFLQTQGITGITKSQLLKFHYWWNRRCGGMLLQKHAHVHRSPKIFWFIIIQFNAKTCKSAGQLVATWLSYRKAQMWPKTKFLNSVIAMSVATGAASIWRAILSSSLLMFTLHRHLKIRTLWHYQA